MEEVVRINVTLPPQLRQEVAIWQARKGLTLSDMVRNAIDIYCRLDDPEQEIYIGPNRNSVIRLVLL